MEAGRLGQINAHMAQLCIAIRLHRLDKLLTEHFARMLTSLFVVEKLHSELNTVILLYAVVIH